MSATQQKTKTSKPKKEVPLISQELVAKYKITEKDLDLIPSARSIFNKGRASKSSSSKADKKTEKGVKATAQYKKLNSVISSSAKSCTVDRVNKKPEEIAKEKESNLKSFKNALSNALKNPKVDATEVEKVLRTGSKVYCDNYTPKPETSGD